MTSPPNKTGTHNHRIAVGTLMTLIAYGSLFPFAWNFAQPQEFIVIGPIGLVDMLENVVLFLPLGWLLAWHYHGQPDRYRAFAAWFLSTLVLASALQWLQIFLPRTPQLSDIAFNMVGHSLGWGFGAITARRLHRLLQQHENLRSANRFALLMIAIWVIAELFPLIPSFDVSSVANNVKSLFQQDVWQPRRMMLHVGTTVIGLEALAHLIRSASTGRRVLPLAAMATLGILAGKFVVVGQSPGLAVVFGILGGALLWFGIDRFRKGVRLKIVLLTATASYLLHAISPLQLRDPPEPMLWLPFASSLSDTIESVVTTVAFECLCFGAIIWSAVRGLALVGGLTVMTAVLAFACEWAQRYLPTRTPEITSVVLAIAMGWLVATLSQNRTGSPGVRS